MQFWSSLWQMSLECNPRTEKPKRIWEVYWGRRHTNSADVIHIATKVYNLERQLSIMQSLSATSTAAATVQKLSVSELHVVTPRHSKKGPNTENRRSSCLGHSKCKFHYCRGPRLAHPKNDWPTKDAKCYNCGKERHFKSSCKSKKGEREYQMIWAD